MGKPLLALTAGQAIVIVNGVWLGNKDNPVFDNLLIPGAVGIVDGSAIQA